MRESHQRSRQTALFLLFASTTIALSGTVRAQPAAAPAEPQSLQVAAPRDPGPAPVAAPPPAAAAADVEESTRAALSRWGCKTSQVLGLDGRWYAACGAAGVWLVEPGEAGALVLRQRWQVSGRAEGLFLRGGAIWVETAHVEAYPLTQLTSASDLAPLVVPAPSAGGELVTTSKATSLLAPPRIGRLWSVEGALRPYLPLQSLGVALLASAAVTYRGERAWFAQLQLMPLGGTATKDRDAALFGGAISGGYDHHYFALGLGVGTLRRGERHDEFDQMGRYTGTRIEQSYGLSITQHVRLGALDGLNFMLTNVFVLNDQRWRFGFFDLTVQVPLNRQTWLTGAGGGAQQAGYAYGEVGLRRLLRGDRGSGSLFVKPSVGIAGIDNRVDGIGLGPMIGCHVEWRR